MTVAGWIGFIIIALTLIAFGIIMGLVVSDGEVYGVIIGTLIAFILCVVVFAGMRWYFNNTASGARAYKTQESNFNMGINRKVTVYDMEGDVIQEYEGKFDIEYDNDRILFDDEHGLRHIIYYPTGTVIVDELGD